MASLAKASIPISDPYSEEKPDEEKDDGVFCQYNKSGNDYFPTTATVKKLEAGVYKIKVKNNMYCFSKQDIVTDDLVRLDDFITDMLIEEIEKFWALKSKFGQLGFSFKRGFLLHGKAGTGKTSSLMLATKDVVARGGIALVVDTNPSVISMMLKDLRTIEPEKPVVVILEDLDTLIRNFGEGEILSLLDGESSIDHVIYIATTNYPEDLDGRITNRPSRFDRVVEVGFPNPKARFQYLCSRNDKIKMSEKEIDVWVEKTDGMSIAQIKEALICVHGFGEKLDSAIDRIKNMKFTPTSEGAKNPMGFGNEENRPTRKTGFGV